MIKVLANRVLEFNNGEKKATTKLGFCELPDWVEEDEYYKLALVSGDIRSFESTKDADELADYNDKKAALEQDLKDLEDKISLTEEKGKEKIQALKEEIAELEEARDKAKKSNK